MSIHHLQVKHLTLAQEARIIRRKEHALRKWKKKQNVDHKKKVEELALALTDPKAENAMIGLKGIREFVYVANRRYDPDIKAGLRAHRLDKVKPEARAAHLALGYLRKMPYRVMETMAYHSPTWALVWKNIIRFGGVEENDESKKLFLEWADATVDISKVGTKHNLPNFDYTRITGLRTPSYFIKRELKWD